METTDTMTVADSRTVAEAAAALFLPGQSPEGSYILSVLFKRTYNMIDGNRCLRAETDFPLFAGDVHYDGPMNSSVRFESDFTPWKSGTDIVLNGKAYTPGNVPVERLTASLSIGRYTSDILIFGDRTCRFRTMRDPGFSEPEPFIEMDLRYERAYGGTDIYSHPTVQYTYPRNHLGRGFVIKNKRSSVDGLELPNIEDPDDILHPGNLCCEDMKFWQDQPMPRGFGWYSKYWYPRAGLAGVMPADRAVEQELRRIYTLAVPEVQRSLYEQTALPSMDFRFFNGASPGLIVPFLSGDESIRLVNLSPEGTFTCRLPDEYPALSVDIGLGVTEPEIVLHTLQIRMEERQVDLVWRGAIPYPGPDWLPEMRKKEIFIQ
ncbi:MAG: DUF2169 domain-containing protein [Chitinispirillaceae bacterium]|nr:DUF2169 domain-containing protein [Chitinispirillaceae bacterium]